MVKHKWDYCEHCEIKIVICGTCGNNCCNGGYGEVSDENGNLIPCPDCKSAYELQEIGY